MKDSRDAELARRGPRSDRIRRLRPPRPESLDPWRAQGLVVEPERRRAGADWREETTATLFLTGAECPFTCVFCDLWKHTTPGPTPPGALPAQIRSAVSELEGRRVERLKLYNASNFFDRRAVPEVDDVAIAEAVDGFDAVTVESHPRFVGDRCFDFAERLEGRLEVAVGVETVHPGAHAQLNKGCDLEQTWRATGALLERGIEWRAFALLGVPFLGEDDPLEWAVRTVDEVARRGASAVSLIPVRGGNGELERLASEGHFRALEASVIETIFESTVEDTRLTVQLDLWDLEEHLPCVDCRDQRRARLERMNLTGRVPEAVDCGSCAA